MSRKKGALLHMTRLGMPTPPAVPLDLRIAQALGRLEQDMADLRLAWAVSRMRHAPPPPPARPAPPRPRTVRRARPKPDLGPSVLTPAMRVALKAKAHGLTQEAIARSLGITPGAVSLRLSRARERAEARRMEALCP